MHKRPRDFSFERDGRSLSAWLVDLVDEDAPTRLAAGEALQAMKYALPSIHTKLGEIEWGSSRDIAGHGERFKERVRAAVWSRSFPEREFVRRLIAYRIALRVDWHRRAELAQRPDEPFAPIEMTAAGLMAGMVFNTLAAVLLADRPGLRAMLEHKTLSHDAAKALARIGPPAVDFAGFFLDRLDRQEIAYRFDGAQALGSIGRDDPAVIDGLLRRLRTGTDAVQVGAAMTLGHAGPPLAGRLEIAIDFLLAATAKPALIHAATEALASVGRDREEALRRALELAAPRPPRWRAPEDFPEYRYDEAMSERGAAIDALRHFRGFADRVVPVLVDAFDTFEEYDSDWSYHGEHGRVCWVLGEFGPDAAPAVPRLLRYLDDWQARREDDLEWPKDAFGLLAKIGLPAVGALPVLERIHAAQANGGETRSDDLDCFDPLDRAILALRGDHSTSGD